MNNKTKYNSRIIRINKAKISFQKYWFLKIEKLGIVYFATEKTMKICIQYSASYISANIFSYVAAIKAPYRYLIEIKTTLGFLVILLRQKHMNLDIKGTYEC